MKLGKLQQNIWSLDQDERTVLYIKVADILQPSPFYHGVAVFQSFFGQSVRKNKGFCIRVMVKQVELLAMSLPLDGLDSQC